MPYVLSASSVNIDSCNQGALRFCNNETMFKKMDWGI